MICNICGSQMNDNLVFCPKCGMKNSTGNSPPKLPQKTMTMESVRCARIIRANLYAKTFQRKVKYNNSLQIE